MKPPENPENDEQRVKDLKFFRALETPKGGELDHIVRIVALACDTEFAAVSLIDEDYVWFKAIEGNWGLEKIPQAIWFCGHTILNREITEIPDLQVDPRFADNPFVTGGPLLRFYIGIPLVLPSGSVIGSLCAFDCQSKRLSTTQHEQLVLLAHQIVALLVARHSKRLEASFSAFAEQTGSMMATLDLDAEKVSYVNPAWRRRCAYRSGDDMTVIRDLVPQLDPAIFSKVKGDSNEPKIYELHQTVVKFSEEDTALSNVRVFPDNLASPHRSSFSNMVVMIENEKGPAFTDNMAKDAISRARLLEKVATITRNPVIITDIEGRIEWVNVAFESITGYQLDEVLGKRPGDVLQGPGTCPHAVRRIGEHLKAGRGLCQELLNYSKDGKEYWIELDIQPVNDVTGKLQHFVAVQTDITKRKQQEEALRFARDEAERVSSMKSRFIATVSHELRTPLNGILGISEYLSESVPSEFKEDLSTLHYSAKHLLHILNDLIDLASIEAGAMTLRHEPFDLGSVLQDSLKVFQASAKKKCLALRLTTRNINDGLWLRGDETRLRQVMMNLLGNAIKFTEKGGVTLHCSVADTAKEQVKVKFAVQDTGPGIDEQDQERVFRPFERSDSPAAGAGLGLSISREILHLMGTKLMMSCSPDEGCCFSFELTLPRARQPQPVKSGEMGQTPNVKIRQVLVVDDDPVNLRVIQGLLTKLGVPDIRVCQSGARALVEWHGLKPDIVLVDVRMPGMDGYTFLNRYRKQEAFSGSPPLIVACSASHSLEDQENFLDAGFDFFVGKPVSTSSLRQLLAGPKAGESRSAEYRRPESRSDARQLIITDALKRKMANNSKLIYSFLGLLAQQHESCWDGIDLALAENDLARLAIAIHTLKGQVGYFGEKSAVYRSALVLDQALKENPEVVPTELVAALRREMQELTADIRKLLSERNGES